MLGNRVTDLEARLATQGKLLAEREYENKQLRQTNEAAQRTVKELRDELQASSGGQSACDRKTACRESRRRGTASRSPATSAPNCSATSTRSSSRRKAHGRPSAWKMRCCANASTTSPLRSQNSRCNSKGRIRAIEAMLAAEPAATENPASRPTVRPMAQPQPQPPEGGGTLAERIRALQSHASRARQQGRSARSALGGRPRARTLRSVDSDRHVKTNTGSSPHEKPVSGKRSGRPEVFPSYVLFWTHFSNFGSQVFLQVSSL